jgi:hypothetical protein
MKQKRGVGGTVSPQFTIQPGSSRMTVVPNSAASAPRVKIVPTEPPRQAPVEGTPPSSPR